MADQPATHAGYWARPFPEYNTDLLNTVEQMEESNNKSSAFQLILPWALAWVPEAAGPSFDLRDDPLEEDGAEVLSSLMQMLVRPATMATGTFKFTFDTPNLLEPVADWEGHRHHHSIVIRSVVYAKNGVATGDGLFVTAYAVYLNHPGVIEVDGFATADWAVLTLTHIRRTAAGDWLPIRVAWSPGETARTLLEVDQLDEPARSHMTAIHTDLQAITDSFTTP